MEREAPRPQNRAAEAPKEQVAPDDVALRTVASVATAPCASCGAETPPEDQFYSDLGALCPSCHLAHAELPSDETDWLGGVVRMVGNAALPTVILWFTVGLTMAWAEGTMMVRTAIATILVMMAVLGVGSLAYVITSAAELRQVTVGPAASVESTRTRVFRGLGATWGLLCALSSLAMLAYTFVSMI